MIRTRPPHEEMARKLEIPPEAAGLFPPSTRCGNMPGVLMAVGQSHYAERWGQQGSRKCVFSEDFGCYSMWSLRWDFPNGQPTFTECPPCNKKCSCGGGRGDTGALLCPVLDTAKPLLLQSTRFMGTESINKIQVHETVFQIEWVSHRQYIMEVWSRGV